MRHTWWHVWMNLRSDVYNTHREVVVRVATSSSQKHAEAVGVREAYRRGVMTNDGPHTLADHEYVTVLKAIELED